MLMQKMLGGVLASLAHPPDLSPQKLLWKESCPGLSSSDLSRVSWHVHRHRVIIMLCYFCLVLSPFVVFSYNTF